VSQLTLIAADLMAILLLVFGIYFPRHRRRDMIVALLSINIGVLAIAVFLSSLEISTGLGIGLFGVLSIIRLRSDELDQREVAYYFAALALGLLGGTGYGSWSTTFLLMALLVVVLWGGDHPALLGRYRSQTMVLDRAFVDEREARVYLTTILGTNIRRIVIRNVDLVQDTTRIDVRFEIAPLPEGEGTPASWRESVVTGTVV